MLATVPCPEHGDYEQTCPQCRWKGAKYTHDELAFLLKNIRRFGKNSGVEQERERWKAAMKVWIDRLDKDKQWQRTSEREFAKACFESFLAEMS